MNIHRLRYLVGLAGAIVAVEHSCAGTKSPVESVNQHQWYFAPSSCAGNSTHETNVYKISPFLDPNEYLRRIANGYRGNLALDADLMNHAKHPQSIQSDELFDAQKYRKMLEQRQRERAESGDTEHPKDKPGKGDAYEQLLRPITGYSTGPVMWYPSKKASARTESDGESPPGKASESPRNENDTESVPKRIPVAPTRSSAVLPSVNDLAQHTPATREAEVVVRRRSSPEEDITMPPAFRASSEPGGSLVGNSINRSRLAQSTARSQESSTLAPSVPKFDRKDQRSIANNDRSPQHSESVQQVVSLQAVPATSKSDIEHPSLAGTVPTPAPAAQAVGLAILKDECKEKNQTVEAIKPEAKEEAKSWTQKTSSTADDKYKIKFR